MSYHQVSEKSSMLPFRERLERIRPLLEAIWTPLPAPHPSVVLVLSVTDGDTRATSIQIAANSFDDAWKRASLQLKKAMIKKKISGLHLRGDLVVQVEKSTWGLFNDCLKQVKRNYCRRGVSLDPDFRRLFLEQELNANAMLYGGNTITHCVLNEKNFSIAVGSKYGCAVQPQFRDEQDIWLFDTQGVYCGQDGIARILHDRGRDAGRRITRPLSQDILAEVVDDSSQYLARQVSPDGKFIYGYHPCFDRQIPAYNALRHASTTYSMLEAWEFTQSETLFIALSRALDYLRNHLIHRTNKGLAFVVDTGDEVKLGANATAILALTKYAELTGSDEDYDLMQALALGILHMHCSDGSFVHVLNWPDLSVKEDFRIVYYEGEATFALMRLYRLTKDSRWIASAEHAFEHFIAKDYWKFHDHWLSYSANELTFYRPDPRYFRFGIQNFQDYLGFVRQRITTFPTLLELMMAGRYMLDRIRAMPNSSELLSGIDEAVFDEAMHYRAEYLMNGHFWPEFAMFFRNPNRIMGSFFIRHHAFRVRIDDVEHYLSGLISYARWLKDAHAPQVK